MNRRKSSLLGMVIIGTLLLAQAGAVLLALQLGLGSTAGTGVIVLAAVALLLWTGLIAAGLVACAQHLLLNGLEDACGRLEAARSSAHVGVLAAAPTLDLLGRTLRRQNSQLAELRDALLASSVAGGASGGVVQAHRLARAAGTAAGLLRTNSDILRLVDTLDDWLTTTRTRHETVRECSAELRETLEHLPVPEEADPVIGFAVAEGAPSAGADPWADLPPALRERMRGQVPSEEAGEEDLDRN